MSEKLALLRQILSEMGSVLVAYSGGLDSAFVLKVATDVLGEGAVGLTAVSPSLPAREREDAARIAQRLGARHLMVETHELEDPAYAANPTNRCFFCKSELYRVTAKQRELLGLAFVVNGTNVDDLGDFRPGLEAAREAGVRSPLAEAGLTKGEVRELARELGMDSWDKPAAACLSSRIPYGTPVTPERLARIEAFEGALRELGFRQVRVRHHDELARVEVSKSELSRAFDLRDELVLAGKRAGYTYVTLDLSGYRTGSLNELLRTVG